jgi:predicted pyridoxine 5'-phosphate oxidase superfamily flavin-nucleotide-binding protein
VNTHQPFHDGEIAVQQRAGERDAAVRHGAGISSRIAPAALSFLARQRLVALSTAGDDEGLWTSVWCGEPGFVQSADGRRVTILRSMMPASAHDPVIPRLSAHRDVGMLAIELASRRRLRINGAIERISDEEIDVLVRESVGNCPKYIQRREAHEAAAATVAPPAGGRELDDERRALIECADTVFVGSLHPERGVDTSHRGGAPGFIRVVDAGTLRIPDYPGNSMFMTLGNFAADARAGLAVLDFERRLIVSLSGTARLLFDVEDPRHPTGGTGRYWDFAVEEWTAFGLPALLDWQLLDASPFNPPARK